MNKELVDNGMGFIPTSVTTFYSPIVEVEEMVRRSNTPRLGNPGPTLNMKSLTDDD